MGTSGRGRRLGSPVIDVRQRLGRGGCRRATAASPWRRFCPGSDSGEWRRSAGKQAVMGAPLGPRGDAQLLAWRCERVDGCARCGGGNGGRRTGGLLIGGCVHGVSKEVSRCPWRPIKGMAPGNRRARVLPAGDVAGGLAGGSATRPWGFGGAPRGGYARGSRETAS
jgi:hypothetical protein